MLSTILLITIILFSEEQSFKNLTKFKLLLTFLKIIILYIALSNNCITKVMDDKKCILINDIIWLGCTQ